VLEVLRDEDGVAGVVDTRRLGDPDRHHRGKSNPLQVAQDVVLALRDLDRLLLEGDEVPVDDEEADEMARRPDRELAELQARRPVRERPLPGQVEQRSGTPQPEARELSASCADSR
jgi:hypothetical protein